MPNKNLTAVAVFLLGMATVVAAAANEQENGSLLNCIEK